MLAKVWTVAAAAVVAGVLAMPAPAAYAQTSPAPAAKPAPMAPMTMKKPTMHKSSHKMSCYDYAYQSAAMQNCLAKGTSKPMMKRSSKKKTAS